jgi:hypothetical protein
MPKQVWTNEQLQQLREMWPNNPARIIAPALGLSRAAVKAKAFKLRLRKLPTYNRARVSPQALTNEERTFVIDNYTKFPNHELAKITGRSESAIQAIGREFNLSRKNDGCFKKGHRSWNFRMKGIQPYHAKTVATQFKKGNKSANTLYDGAITIRSAHKDRNDKPYKFIRVEGKWLLYHRWMWEQQYGAVPAKHIVIFIDGDTMNVDIGNLECISMAENARRNYNPKGQYASKELSDKYIAGRMAKGDKKLRKALINGAPELIELKRIQLNLKRKIKNERDNQTRKTA